MKRSLKKDRLLELSETEFEIGSSIWDVEDQDAHLPTHYHYGYQFAQPPVTEADCIQTISEAQAFGRVAFLCRSLYEMEMVKSFLRARLIPCRKIFFNLDGRNYPNTNFTEDIIYIVHHSQEEFTRKKYIVRFTISDSIGPLLHRLSDAISRGGRAKVVEISDPFDKTPLCSPFLRDAHLEEDVFDALFRSRRILTLSSLQHVGESVIEHLLREFRNKQYEAVDAAPGVYLYDEYIVGLRDLVNGNIPRDLRRKGRVNIVFPTGGNFGNYGSPFDVLLLLIFCDHSPFFSVKLSKHD